MPQLKIGDIIIRVGGSAIILGTASIERLTKTQAVANNGMRFKLDTFENGTLTQIGETYSVSTWWTLATPQRMAANDRARKVRRVKELMEQQAARVGSYTDAELDALIAILQPKPQHTPQQ